MPKHTYTQNEFDARLIQLHNSDYHKAFPNSITENFSFFTGGKLRTYNTVKLHNRTIHHIIIYKPTHTITTKQLSDIHGIGKHGLSKGSIFYEEDYCYITWSNLNHI